jgi:hypothetical protein
MLHEDHFLTSKMVSDPEHALVLVADIFLQSPSGSWMIDEAVMEINFFIADYAMK